MKPGGSFTCAPAGFGTSFGNLAVEGVSYAGGSFAILMRWARPGTSFFQSSEPLTGLSWPGVPGGGPKLGAPPRPARSGVAALKLPSLRAWKYAMMLARSVSSATGTTMAEPGTTVVGEFRKRFSVMASQVRPEAFSAGV